MPYRSKTTSKGGQSATVGEIPGQNLNSCVNSLKYAGVPQSRYSKQSRLPILGKIDRFTKDSQVLPHIEKKKADTGLKNLDSGSQIILQNVTELMGKLALDATNVLQQQQQFPTTRHLGNGVEYMVLDEELGGESTSMEYELEPKEIDMDGLCEKMKRTLNIACEELRSELNLFGRVHDLSYEHCHAKNDGTEIIANQSIDRALFDACVGSGGANDDEGNNGCQGLPDPNKITGDERLELFRQMLDEFNWERQDNQVDFHEMMLQTALPCIFEKEWDSDYDRILRIFGLDQHCAETFIVCPRRFGKTVAVAMFCAVYMYLIPDASIAIFSTAQRTSGKMMLAIYQFMKELPFFRDAVFITKNSETICIELYGNRKTMWCYPGKVGVCTFL